MQSRDPFIKLASVFLTIILSISGFYVRGEEEDVPYTPFIDGYEDGTFRPEAPVSRAEAIQMTAALARDAEERQEPAAFSDVAAESWYAEAVAELSCRGFLTNYTNELNPEGNITRAEFGALAYQLKQGAAELPLPELFTRAVKDNILTGDEDGNIRPEEFVTRAEAVTMLNRAMGHPASEADISMLYKGAFSDVTPRHWAFGDIILASVSSHRQVSLPANIPEDYETKWFDKDNERDSQWKVIPMVTQEMKDRGLMGGEGGQRLCSIALSRDARFLMVGTDVAGFWGSYDGGATWQGVFGGLQSRGGFAISIDPVNENRILVYGGYPLWNEAIKQANDTNGLYLSEDQGRTWRFVLQQQGACMVVDFRESIAFDPASYDAEQDKCMVAYWSRPWHTQSFPNMEPFRDESQITILEGDKKGLWKTEDGGESWFVVHEEMTDGVVKVSPADGTVYVSNFKGFHRSTDGGETFQTVLGGAMIYGMDVIDSYPSRVYVNDYEGVLVSEDNGVNFTRIKSKNFPKSYDITNPDRIVRNLKVSPANPKNMMVMDFQGHTRYVSQKYYSHDGGVSWTQSVYDASDDFFKANNRDSCFVWHPTDENKLWGFGGDWVVSSADAGATFKWDYNGGSAVCVVSRHAFNLYNPDLFYYGSQDFHGAYTKDGGETWKHMWRATGSQGAGFVYGAYAADENTLFGLVSSGQSVDGVGSDGGWDGVREIRISRDGGNTWVKTGVYKLENHAKKWSEKCYQSPKDPNILFAANYRSDDYGYTWEKMECVNVVYCHNPYGQKELYGSWQDKIMVSYDDGLSWQVFADALVPSSLAETPEKTEIWSIAVDGINQIVYYVSGTAGSGTYLVQVQAGVSTDITDRLVRTEFGSKFELVAVDPRYPNVIYVGGCGGSYMEDNGIQRSVDGGESFQVMTVNGLGNSVVRHGSASGLLVRDLLVHPVTGELWAMNSTRGWAKIDPPYEN